MMPFFAILSVVLAFLNRTSYLYSILKGQTKPHAFSWITWSIISTIAFTAQWTEGAGMGAWARGLSTLFSFIFVVLAFQRGEKNFTRGDKITLAFALCAIPLWYFTKTPVWSVILVTIIDTVGYYPTVRKSLTKPQEEAYISWLLSGLSSTASLFAIENINISTTLYNTVMAVGNTGFGIFLILRQRQLNSRSA